MIIRMNYQNSDSFAELPQIYHRIRVFFFVFFFQKRFSFLRNEAVLSAVKIPYFFKTLVSKFSYFLKSLLIAG